MSDKDTISIIVLILFFVVAIGAIVYSMLQKKKYMRQQKETGEDKRAMLGLMAEVMGDIYEGFKYVVGYYTKTTQSGRTTTYYYFPYILAFNASQVIIFPFIKKEGKLYIRNRLPVDWNSTKFTYITKKKGFRVEFSIAGDRMPINVDSVVSSSGVEKSDRPLCVYQEQEVEELKGYLPRYKESAKK